MRGLRAALVLALATGSAGAETSLRPFPRPADLTGAAPATATGDHIRPMPRPDFTLAVAIQTGPEPHIRPQPRPDLPPPAPEAEIQLVAQPLAPTKKPAKPSLKGAVCQRAEIKGKELPPIRSSNRGCNVPDAVLVSQVAGVALNPPATINCEEAQALSNWVQTGLQPAFNNTIIALNVADSYACRPRNNVRGNPVSVHGLGQAIDIAAFVTNSGRTYTVAQNYNAQIRAAQKAGCGTFHTILGPGSDGFHETHIHFDVSHHGGRDYCH